MRWLALILLVVNMLYLSWEHGRQQRAGAVRSRVATAVTPDMIRLNRFDELTEPPPSKASPAQSAPLREMPAQP